MGPQDGSSAIRSHTNTRVNTVREDCIWHVFFLYLLSVSVQVVPVTGFGSRQMMWQWLLELHSRSVQLVVDQGSGGRTSAQCTFFSCSVAKTDFHHGTIHGSTVFAPRRRSLRGPLVIGAARLNRSSRTARWNQWRPQTWISSVCLATLSGPPSALDTSILTRLAP